MDVDCVCEEVCIGVCMDVDCVCEGVCRGVCMDVDCVCEGVCIVSLRVLTYVCVRERESV